MFRIQLISAIFLLIVWNSLHLNGQVGTTKPTKFTWEGALQGNKAIWKVDDTLNFYKNLDGINISLKLVDPHKINTNTLNPSEFNDYTQTNTFYNKGNLAFQLTSSQKTQTACFEFGFSKPVFLNDFQVWDIDMLQSGISSASTYQDSVSFFARSKAGNVPLSLIYMDESPSFTIKQQSAKANFIAGVNGDITHNNTKGAVFLSSVEPLENFTLCYANGSQDDGLSNSHAIKISEFFFSELLGGISGTVINKNTGLTLAGSVIKLVDANGNVLENKHGWAMQSITDETGQYHFDHLPMGTYTIVQTNPAGFKSVEDADGNNDDKIVIELDAKKYFSENNDFFEIEQGPLPVKLESFNVAQTKDGEILSEWSLAIEQNCSHYEIQILTKENHLIGSDFITFNVENKGFYRSVMPYDGAENKLYIKLIQYDLDGTKTVLGTKVIALNHEKANIVFYPNPTKNMLYLKNASDQEIIKTVLLDVSGKELFQTNGQILGVDMTDLSKGIYFIQCIMPNETHIQKILKE